MPKQTITSRIMQLRENLGFNKNQFSVFLDIPNTYITQYEGGKSEPANKFYLRLKDKIPNLNLDWLITGEGKMYIPEHKPASKTKLRKVPILGNAECGRPSSQWYTGDHQYLEIENVKGYNNVFALKASGDSMSPYIVKGDILISADVPFENIRDRSAVVVAFKAPAEMYEANAKLMMRDKDHIILYSVNTKFEPNRVSLTQVNKIYKLIRIVREVN